MNHPFTPEQPKPSPYWLPETPDASMGEGVKDVDPLKAEKPKPEEIKNKQKIENKKEEKEKPEQQKLKKTEQKEEKTKTDAELELEKKQQKRAQLVERSLYYKHYYDEMPPPRDPLTLTRLLIAEHIVALHNQITKPEEDDAILSKEQLLAVFDYMGELSDKLEYPNEESRPEIKEAYDTLTDLAEDTIQEQPNDIPAVIQANKQVAETEIHETNINEKQQLSAPPLLRAGLAFIAAISQVRESLQGNNKTVVRSQGSMGIRSDPTLTIPTRPSSTPIASPHVTAPTSASPTEARRAYREAPRNELGIRPASRLPEQIALVAIASAVAAAHNKTPNNASVEYPQPVAQKHRFSPSHEQLIATTYSSATPTAAYAETLRSTAQSLSYSYESAPTPARPETSSFGNHNVTDYTSRKIEHLPLQSLLAMAETVPIGYGKRLKYAYEKGYIDKEGLIKVLKSRSKNHDFVREYKQQVIQRRNLAQSSPEFLKSAGNNDQNNLVDATAQQTPNITQSSGTAANPTAIDSLFPKASAPHSTAKDASLAFAEDTSTGWRKVMIIAGSIAAVIVALVLIFN